MLELLLAAFPYYAIGLGGCLIILTNTCHIRISMWVFKAAYWLKIIIINFFVEIIMRYYFGEHFLHY